MQHIPSDSLELYALGRLTEHELAQVEEHLLCCAECCAQLASIQDFTTGLCSALREITSELIAEHQTADGPIRLYIRRLLKVDEERWLGRIHGVQTDGGVPAATRGQAVRGLETLFREMYKEHRCGPGCIVHARMRLSG